MGAFEESDFVGGKDAGDGFYFSSGAGERRKRRRVGELGKALWVGDEEVVRVELTSGCFVLLGVAEEACGRNGVQGVALDEVVVVGIAQGCEGKLEERAAGNDGEEACGF